MSPRISRRSFLALAGSIGAVAGPGLTIADAMGSEPGSGGVLPRPGWARAVPQPTVRIDDSVYGRFDKRLTVFPTSSGGSLGRYVGPEKEATLQALERERTRALAPRPGFQARERALARAAGTVISLQGGPNSPNRGILSWRPLRAPQSEPVQSDGWLNSEEATRDVKIAARFLGADLVGICRLDPRHVYTHELDGKSIFFEDVEQPYEEERKRVIPTQCRYAVTYAVRMSGETVKRAPTALTTAASNMVYSQLAHLGASLAEFIRAMGYVAIPTINDTVNSTPFAVEAGLGELGRHNRLITPEFGPMVRLGTMITNLKLIPDNPVDAGIVEFCRSCAKCAEACPAGALSFAPSPTFIPAGPWNNPGHEAWFEDAVKCFSYLREITTSCMICFSVCPYGKKNMAAAHGVVKATVARTPAFNGVLRSIDDAFGYGGQKSPEKWWGLDLPPHGLD
jgi:epoxyqueuosine reductase